MSKKLSLWLVFTALVITLLLATACASPTPQIVEVVQTVEVEKVVTVEVPVKQEIVTLAYNGYFEKTFGPATHPSTHSEPKSPRSIPTSRCGSTSCPTKLAPCVTTTWPGSRQKMAPPI